MNKTILPVIVLIILSYSARSEWVTLNSGTAMNLNSVFFVNQQTGFICGAGSVLRKTTDGGLNWIALDPFAVLEIRSVYFLNANTGLICGNGGMIAKSTNGGMNWNTITSGTSNTLLTLSFYNSSIGVCCGNSGTTLYTTNGGDNWLEGYPTGYLVTFYTSFMLNASTGYSAGVNTIFSPLVGKTTNGGANWTYSSFMVNNNEAAVYGIHFFNDQNGVAVSNLWNGQGGISRTTNGGVNWTSQIFLYGLFGLDFPSPNTGYCAGSNGSIMKSSDGGINWTAQTSGTSSTLRAVYFVDSLFGFAVGQAGTLLKTTNGGVTGLLGNSNENPEEFRLYQNYPNPFNPRTKIKFDTPPQPSPMGREYWLRLVVYDILGREITVLVNEQLKPGTYEVSWDASAYPSGVYLYQLSINNERLATKKMVLIK